MIKIIDVKKLPPRKTPRKKYNILGDIDDFLATGADACEIILEEGESPNAVCGALRNAIDSRKHYGDMLYVTQRAGRVFLVRWPDKRSNNAK